MAADLALLRAALRELDPGGDVENRLPLLDPMRGLLGDRLRRGAVIAVEGEIARSSLAMLTLAGVSAAGGWCGVVGMPSFGYLAAEEYGIRLATLAAVPDPGIAWADVVAALVTGMDAVLVDPAVRVPGGLARRLVARARQHRCTLVTLGPAWEGTDVRISAVRQEWYGLDRGHGRLRTRLVTAVASHRPRSEVELWLPAAHGAPDTGGVEPGDIGPGDIEPGDIGPGDAERAGVVRLLPMARAG